MTHAEDMAMMFDCGWSLKEIAAHCGISVDEVIRLIRKHVRRRQERGESSSQIADWTGLPKR